MESKVVRDWFHCSFHKSIEHKVVGDWIFCFQGSMAALGGNCHLEMK